MLFLQFHQIYVFLQGEDEIVLGIFEVRFGDLRMEFGGESFELLDAVFETVIMADVEESGDEEDESDKGGGVTENVAP